jgi:hypothetical protein
MTTDSAAFTRLAARCADDLFFLASALAAYQRRRALDDEALAGLLGCDAAELTELRLFRRPGASTQWTAEEDIGVIVRRFGIDAEALCRIVLEDT